MHCRAVMVPPGQRGMTDTMKLRLRRSCGITYEYVVRTAAGGGELLRTSGAGTVAVRLLVVPTYPTHARQWPAVPTHEDPQDREARWARFVRHASAEAEDEYVRVREGASR